MKKYLLVFSLLISACSSFDFKQACKNEYPNATPLQIEQCYEFKNQNFVNKLQGAANQIQSQQLLQQQQQLMQAQEFYYRMQGYNAGQVRVSGDINVHHY